MLFKEIIDLYPENHRNQQVRCMCKTHNVGFEVFTAVTMKSASSGIRRRVGLL
jgi:hypothetical protein